MGDKDTEKRLRDVEEFIAQVKGGRRLFLWICSAAGALLGLLAIFWDKLFGGGG
jgi:hypothetical protein